MCLRLKSDKASLFIKAYRIFQGKVVHEKTVESWWRHKKSFYLEGKMKFPVLYDLQEHNFVKKIFGTRCEAKALGVLDHCSNTVSQSKFIYCGQNFVWMLSNWKRFYKERLIFLLTEWVFETELIEKTLLIQYSTGCIQTFLNIFQVFLLSLSRSSSNVPFKCSFKAIIYKKEKKY